MQINNAPTIKEIKPINFLYFRTETQIKDLANFFPVARDLYKEAVNRDLHVTGPIHWHYFGFNGDVSKPFTLEIALPVSEIIAAYDGPFHFKRTETFKCVVLRHEGKWSDLPQCYSQMMHFIAEKNLAPVAVNREVYVNSDFVHPDANVTEVQIGIQ
jgi:effector-binding domain-containing protein